ncbi:MAG: hypothetical protein MJ237_07310 [bacterium]|nr:hypothetical protein [bacterium]
MKKILALLTALFISIPAYASITVSPTRIELNANKIRNNYATMAIEIRGDSQKATRYRGYTGYFKIGDNGQMIFADGDKTDPHNISDKVRFVPSEFTVPPGKSQKVRVNIANIKNIPDGESRALIYLEDVNTKEMNVPNGYGIGAQLILKTRVAVPVYVDKGNFTKKADVETFGIVKQKDGLYTEMKIVSSGNSRIRYGGMIQIASGKKLISEYALEQSVVAEKSTRIVRQKIDTSKIKEAGEYSLRLVFQYTDENGNKKNIKKDAILKIKGEKI